MCYIKVGQSRSFVPASQVIPAENSSPPLIQSYQHHSITMKVAALLVALVAGANAVLAAPAGKFETARVLHQSWCFTSV